MTAPDQPWPLDELVRAQRMACEGRSWDDIALALGRSGEEVRRRLEGQALGLTGMCATERGDVKGAREAFENGERMLSLLGPSRDLAIVQQNFGSFCNRERSD